MLPSVLYGRFLQMIWSAPVSCKVKQAQTIIPTSVLVWYFYGHTQSPSSSKHDEWYCDRKE